MIARLWSAAAPGRRPTPTAYQRHVTTQVFPELKAIAGHRGAQVLRREEDARAEFLVHHVLGIDGRDPPLRRRGPGAGGGRAGSARGARGVRRVRAALRGAWNEPHRRGAPLQPLLYAPRRRAAAAATSAARIRCRRRACSTSSASAASAPRASSARDLDLDLGYLSRLLYGLKRSGLVLGEAAKEDARRVRLTLTAKGRKVYQQLDARSRDEVGAMLAKLRGAGAGTARRCAAGGGRRCWRKMRTARYGCARIARATWAG